MKKILSILWISILLSITTANAYTLKEDDYNILKPLYKKINTFLYSDYEKLPKISNALEIMKESYYPYKKNYVFLDTLQKYIDNKRVKLKEYYSNSGVDIYEYKMPYDIRIISSKRPIKFMFFGKDSDLLKASEVSYYYEYPYIVNWSYFGYGTWGNRVYAWLLKVMDVVKSPIRFDDKNLSHVVRYNYWTDEITFIPNKEYAPLTWQMTLEFQVWPQVISWWVVQTGCINDSWHGTTKHYRTLLAVDSVKRKYLIVVASKVDLNQLGQVLLDMDVFKNKAINVMNLDGWSSTAMYSSVYPELNYNTDTRLPIWLGIK